MLLPGKHTPAHHDHDDDCDDPDDHVDFYDHFVDKFFTRGKSLLKRLKNFVVVVVVVVDVVVVVVDRHCCSDR